jgi:hypothetical protein
VAIRGRGVLQIGLDTTLALCELEYLISLTGSAAQAGEVLGGASKREAACRG